MDSAERLAAYLAGDLGDGERAALEDELARDPALRARLDRIREVDQELGRLPPVDPPPEFSQRLREAVSQEVARTPLPGRDPIHLRARRRWVRGAGLAAAAAALAGIVAVGVAGLIGGGEDEAAMPQSAPGVTGREPGPITVTDRDYSASEVEALPARLHELVPGDIPAAQARELESSLTQRLLGEATTGGAAPLAERSRPESDAAQDQDAHSRLDQYDSVPDDAVRDVRRCLPPLLEGAGTIIPVRAEVARFEGEPAVLFVLASRDPDTGAFDRLEVWVTARSDCQVLLFTQGSA